MIAIVCVDEKMGVAFNKRRQSRDSALTKKIVEILEGKMLYISPYSEKLFEGIHPLTISEDYLREVPKDGYCFVEREELSGFEEKIEKLFLVKWNRVYPRDKVLRLRFEEYQLTEYFDFVGSSHEKITVEVYEKRK